MSHSSTEQNAVTIITLSGKIMGGPEAGEINDEIHELIDRGKHKIIIDLQQVEWMNSSGLGILISAITTLKNNNGSMALVHVSDRIMNLLKITKLKDVFAIYDDVESALTVL